MLRLTKIIDFFKVYVYNFLYYIQRRINEK